MEGLPVGGKRDMAVSAMGPGDSRFERANTWREQLERQGIWFAPIRHHSPACAKAVRQLIEEVKPSAVLIEGPSEYDKLLPALNDSATRPPIAVISLRSNKDGQVSYFYPLADFSPEWVGLRAASESGASVAFIDQPFRDAINDQETMGLAAERYYAQSQAIAVLAQAEHCRDHDELWEHLFELRPNVWRRLFREVFTWSALARFDYEPEVLSAEGSFAREGAMARHIERWRGRVAGPLVVITGAFHALALIEAMAVQLLGRKAPEAAPVLKQAKAKTAPSDESAWLIRYDLTRLNSLTGYGAGIRAPGYYQRQWQALSADVTVECLTDIARRANAASTTDHLSVAQVIQASMQARRLAQLRGHVYPGRADLLDACSSCFGQGEPAPAVRDAIGEVFAGSKLGDVPEGTAAPPIVAEARRIADKLRLVVSDSQRRTVTLDVHRSASARRRSRFFWLMSYLDVGFAHYAGGPDYIAWRGMNRLREEWEYAWTPLVEAGLIKLITDGATLHEAARHRLMTIEAQTTRSSLAVAELAARAALIGLNKELTRLREELGRLIEQDSNLASVLGAVRQLLGLWRAREVLEIARPERLLAVVEQASPQLAYLLEKAAHVKAEDEPEIISCLLGAQDLIRTMSEHPSVDVLREGLARLRQGTNSAPGVLGAAMALGVTSGEAAQEELNQKVRAVFAPGADTGYSLRFFNGVMRAAPDLFLHTPKLFDAVDQVVTSLDPSAFLEVLPDLRRCFSALRPLETAKVAEQVARRTGLRAEEIDAVITLQASDLQLGASVEAALLKSLADDCLLQEVGA